MAADDVAGLVRSTLPDASAEAVVKGQVLDLAAEHLHEPVVVDALLEVLPAIPDAGTRHHALALALGLDPAHAAPLDRYHRALQAAWADETDSGMRDAVLRRLAAGLGTDPSLPGFFTGLLGAPGSNDAEVGVALDAAASLPTVDDALVVAALTRTAASPARLQEAALTVASHRPEWGPDIVAAIAPLLVAPTTTPVRLRALDGLREAGRLGPEHVGAVLAITRADTDPTARGIALGLAAGIRPVTPEVRAELARVAAEDADEGVRARAAELARGLDDPPERGPYL